MTDRIEALERFKQSFPPFLFETPEKDFLKPSKFAAILAPMPDHDKFMAERDVLISKDSGSTPLELKPHNPLLTKEQELHLFRQFDFHRHRIIVLGISSKSLNVVESHAAEAYKIKGLIVSCNIRLAIAMAKKRPEYIRNPHMNTLLELASEGNLGMMRAVDCFNYRLGNKFSTYASWAILHNMVSFTNRAEKYNAIFASTDDDLYKIPDYRHREIEVSPCDIDKLLDMIDEREQKVLQNYYGLRGPRMNLLEISNQIGVTKERVRQIRNCGIEKIRAKLGVTDAII